MMERDWPYPPQWQERREEMARCGCSHCGALRADAPAKAAALARYVAAMSTMGAAPVPAGAAP
jgi:hypothetical protein